MISSERPSAARHGGWLGRPKLAPEVGEDSIHALHPARRGQHGPDAFPGDALHRKRKQAQQNEGRQPNRQLQSDHRREEILRRRSEISTAKGGDRVSTSFKAGPDGVGEAPYVSARNDVCGSHSG